MNKIKLLEKLQAFLNADEQKKRAQQKEIRIVLRKLKSKRRKINQELQQCHDEELRKALQLEVDIISAQISKGEQIVKEL